MTTDPLVGLALTVGALVQEASASPAAWRVGLSVIVGCVVLSTISVRGEAARQETRYATYVQKALIAEQLAADFQDQILPLPRGSTVYVTNSTFLSEAVMSGDGLFRVISRDPSLEVLFARHGTPLPSYDRLCRDLFVVENQGNRLIDRTAEWADWADCAAMRSSLTQTPNHCPRTTSDSARPARPWSTLPPFRPCSSDFDRILMSRSATIADVSRNLVSF